MARFVKNWDDLPEFPPMVYEEVAHVLELVRPEPGEIDRCRRDVLDAIRMIASVPDHVPPSVLKKQLSKVKAALVATRIAINELPLSWRRVLNADKFLSELARFSEKSDNMAIIIPVKKRSGGAPAKQTAAMQKRIAAEQAFDLLNDWGRRTPTLTKDGEYLRLAGMLFQIVTEKPGYMERACARVIGNVRRDGLRGSEGPRQRRRQAKLD